MESGNFTNRCIDNKPKVVIITGPTGVGKTAFAIKLALRFNAEIINCDSMQIYRYMDIGTAKPTPEELGLVRHSLIDIVTPDQQFDAAMFSEMAAREEERIRTSGKNVIMVGGTGLYIRAFTNGLFRSEPVESEKLDLLKSEAERLGAPLLHARLAEVDPKASEKIHPNDTFRIIRALEHFEKTGSPISKSWESHGFRESRYQTLKICLHMERSDLYDRINRRVEMMMADGLLEEVKKLLEMGYGRNLKPMRSIGYRHMCEYLAGEVDLKRSMELLKQDTRHYAKRQLTWFRHEPDSIWITPGDYDKALSLLETFLS